MYGRKYCKKIISEYLLGKGSTTISKDLGISKPSILKILREEGIIRKRDNGDYWHCNPKIYQPDYFNKKKNLFASDIWKYDQFKLELIKKSGYNLEVIWESDFLDDNKIISNILNKYVTKPISTPEVSKKN